MQGRYNLYTIITVKKTGHATEYQKRDMKKSRHNPAGAVYVWLVLEVLWLVDVVL